MARRLPVKTELTFAEYVCFEITSPMRHEFIDGSLFVKESSTKRHNFLVGMCLTKLLTVLWQKAVIPTLRM
jgi:hypothetical protein